MRIGPFGVWEILIILIVVLLIFGPRRLPEMAKGLGQSVRAFRKEMRDIKEDFNTDDWDDRPSQRRPPAPPRSEGRVPEPGPVEPPPPGDAAGRRTPLVTPPGGAEERPVEATEPAPGDERSGGNPG
jgi:sec-independent protein translocase protein TatA